MRFGNPASHCRKSYSDGRIELAKSCYSGAQENLGREMWARCQRDAGDDELFTPVPHIHYRPRKTSARLLPADPPHAMPHFPADACIQSNIKLL
jgi:hypothetical protein